MNIEKGKLSILIVLMMSVLLVLTACQSNTENTKEEKTSEQTDESETVKSPEPEIVTVYVRDVLKEPFEEIKASFEVDNKEIKLNVKYLKNDELIEKSMDDDNNAIIFSTEDTVNKLIDEKLIEHKNTGVAMMDELVLFTKEDSTDIQKSSDITDDVRIAILNPEIYEEGKLSKQVFEDDEFEEVDTTDSLIIGDSVDDVKQDILNNNAKVGVLYLTDICKDENFEMLKRLPRSIVEPYIYKVGIKSKEALEDGDSTKKVYDYLLSNDTLDIFSEYGYII